MKADKEILAVVGAYARIEPGCATAVRATVDALAGVETFDLGETNRIGILIEADGPSQAEHILGLVENSQGVWGVWPVSVELEEEPDNLVEDDSTFGVAPD